MLWVGVVAPVAAAGIKGVPADARLAPWDCSGRWRLSPVVTAPRGRRLEAAPRPTPSRGSPTTAAFVRRPSRANWSGPGDATGRLALVMLDVDNFKAVNDAHGHPYGDEVLRSIGKGAAGSPRAAGHRRPGGGEEFAMIVPSATREAAYRGRRACARRRRRRLGSGHRAVLLGGSRGVSGRRRDAVEPLPARRGRALLGEAPGQGRRAASTLGTSGVGSNQAPRGRGRGAARVRAGPDHAGVPAGGGPRQRAPGRTTRRWRASASSPDARPRRGSRGPRMWPRARTSRRRRSGPRYRAGGAPARDPPRGQRQPLRPDLGAGRQRRSPAT